MADADTAVESTATPERQQEAEKLGWIPPSRFKGDPERFIDAEDYIRRGEEVLPIVKEHNKRLQGEVAATNARLKGIEEALAKANEALEAQAEIHSAETARKVQQARDDLKAELAAASEAGDHKGVAELTDKLTLLNAEEPKKEEKQDDKKKVDALPIDPDAVAWSEANPLIMKNRRRAALIVPIAQDLREGGESATGRAFYDKVGAEIMRLMPETKPNGDKVEGGGRHGDDGDTRQSGGKAKNYNSLPATAKAECDSMIKRFVGPGKRHKDEASYRASWAQTYFSQE